MYLFRWLWNTSDDYDDDTDNDNDDDNTSNGHDDINSYYNVIGNDNNDDNDNGDDDDDTDTCFNYTCLHIVIIQRFSMINHINLQNAQKC